MVAKGLDALKHAQRETTDILALQFAAIGFVCFDNFSEKRPGLLVLLHRQHKERRDKRNNVSTYRHFVKFVYEKF